MRAASRDTFSAAARRLADLASAEPDALGRIGDELLGVAGLLTREPALRRALADPARSGADRATLLDGLVAGQVGRPTRDVLDVVSRGRWSRPGELIDGLELLGVEALLAGADRAGRAADVEDELFRFGQVVEATPELAARLDDVRVPAAQRAMLLDDLLQGKADPVTVRLCRLALTGFGGRRFAGGLSRLVELAAERRDRQVARVTVAAPLTEVEERQLARRLAQIYGRSVAVKVTVDPTVLGGARVLIGSDLFDGTLQRRLADARHALTGT
jgi:F-type H+-transporting ATPase subunit delta